MSALPPKADMCGAATDVRYGSEADMLPFSRFKLRPGVNARLFPHIVEMRVPLGGFGSKLDAMHRDGTKREAFRRSIQQAGATKIIATIFAGALLIRPRQKSLTSRSPT